MSFLARRSSSSAFCLIRFLLLSSSIFSDCSSDGIFFAYSLAATEFSKPEMSPERIKPRLSWRRSKYFETLLFFLSSCTFWAGMAVTETVLSANGLLSMIVSAGLDKHGEVDSPSSLSPFSVRSAIKWLRLFSSITFRSSLTSFSSSYCKE